MKFLMETGNESHSSSWQSCQAKVVGGEHDGKYLYQIKPWIINTDWLTSTKHETVVRTIYELPEGTQILIDYKGFQGPEKFIIQLDSTCEVISQEVGTSRLRTYTCKGRYRVIKDLVKNRAEQIKASQTEDF